MNRFRLKFAPHFGMFEHSAGKDLFNQLQFVRDQGFVAFEDVFMTNRDISTQEKIGAKMNSLGIEMGAFIAYADFEKPTAASGDKQAEIGILKKIEEAIEVAKRINTTWMMVLPGTCDQRLPWDIQTKNVIELLKKCSQLVEPHGITLMLEPLNWLVDHPGMFIHKIPQAIQIVKAVNSPSCKILDDLYHQQITEGSLIQNMDAAWDEIVYFQVGDVPGRKEPTTGEINYSNIFQHIHNKGFSGFVGMEHGNSVSGVGGEKAVIETYLKVDAKMDRF